ncbi:MAG: hypothetical protein LAT67_03250 [Balneolales bacterium]|nr:hypothetical protein [Balneolales bacterium]
MLSAVPNSKQPRLELSKDGSHTLYSEQSGSYFHNPNGAVDESLHVYFEASGLMNAAKTDEDISVMEIGFGTGLNLLLLADICERLKPDSKVRFTSVEAFPISPELASELNYAQFLKYPKLFDGLPNIFKQLDEITLHRQKNPVTGKIGQVEYEVHRCLFEHVKLSPKLPFTCILHDPFDPVVSPELWQPDVFRTLKKFSGENAVLTTYGASSAARAALAVAGWLVAKAPGALGKREMTIAALDENRLTGLKRVNEARLIERWNNGEFETGG